MKPQVRAFRDAASQTCHARKFPFARMMEDHGLEDILNEAEAQDWPAKRIAGQALLRCCVTQGKFNNFHVGLLAVMTFLNRHFGRLGQGEQQAFQDLAVILRGDKAPATLAAITEWLESHYK